jgi:hypothetical protein
MSSHESLSREAIVARVHERVDRQHQDQRAGRDVDEDGRIAQRSDNALRLEAREVDEGARGAPRGAHVRL